MIRRLGVFAFAAAAVSFGTLGCQSSRATNEQCRAIFDRMVELELREMGFLDPELTARRQDELAKRYRSALADCEGRSIRDGALDCVARAESTEAISHRCLR